MKTILLLHGALGAKTQLEPLKNLLSKQFNVYTLEFEGHGETFSDKAFSLDLFAENLKSFLDANKITKTSVFGYSMGGYVALRLAMKHPEYYENIITLGTKFHWTPESAAKEVKMLDAEKIQEKVPAFAKHLESLHTANNWKTVLQKTAQLMLGLGNGNASKDRDFRTITAKCHLGVGDEDAMVSQEETKHIVSLISGSSFFIAEDTPHPIEKVNPEKLAALITERLS